MPELLTLPDSRESAWALQQLQGLRHPACWAASRQVWGSSCLDPRQQLPRPRQWEAPPGSAVQQARCVRPWQLLPERQVPVETFGWEQMRAEPGLMQMTPQLAATA